MKNEIGLNIQKIALLKSNNMGPIVNRNNKVNRTLFFDSSSSKRSISDRTF